MVRETLAQMDAVSHVNFEEGHYVLRGNEADSLLPALTSVLQQLDCRLTNLSTRDLGLEDVFISLTGRSIDDVVSEDEMEENATAEAG